MKDLRWREVAADGLGRSERAAVMLSGSGRNKSIVAHDHGDEEGSSNDVERKK